MLGLLQGAAELFPVSSLGHSVIAPRLLGWDIHQSRRLLPDVPGRHPPGDRARAARVLLARLGADRRAAWAARSAPRSIDRGRRATRWLGWLLVIGTIPAGLLGLALEHPLRSVFASPVAAALFLFLQRPDAVRRRALAAASRRSARTRASATSGSAPSSARARRSAIGAAQAIALLPGFSRSGAAMAGGLRAGPLQRGRRALLVPAGDADHRRRRACSSCPTCSARRATACAARRSSARCARPLTAYLSVRFLVRFFETNRLTPVRRLLPRRRRGLRGRPRPHLSALTRRRRPRRDRWRSRAGSPRRACRARARCVPGGASPPRSRRSRTGSRRRRARRSTGRARRW